MGAPQGAESLQTESSSGLNGLNLVEQVFYPISQGSGGDAGFGVSIGTNGVSCSEHASVYFPPISVYTGTLTEHVFLVRVSNKTASIYVDGTLQHTGLQSTKTNLVFTRDVCLNSSPSANIKISEIVVTSSLLSASDVSNMNSYLASANGL